GSRIVTWWDGQTNITTSNTISRTIVVTNPLPDNTWPNSFSVLGLVDSNNCAGSLPTNTTVTVYPRPKATVGSSGPTNFCSMGTATIQASLQGIGPWTVVWSITNHGSVT